MSPDTVPPISELPSESVQEESYPFWNWEDVALFFALGFPCLVLSLAAMELIIRMIPGEQPRALQAVIAQLTGYSFWFASLVLLLRLRYEKPFWQSLRWVMPRQGFWRSVFQGPMLAFAIAWIGAFLRVPNVDGPMKELLADRVSIMLLGVFAVTVGPLCEELAFRGFLMPKLVKQFGSWQGIVLAAIPFSVLHGPQYSWSWKHLLLLTIAGMAFGRVRQATGSTAAAAMTHATYNLTLFSAFMVQSRIAQH
jgi:uncharacterized protein